MSAFSYSFKHIIAFVLLSSTKAQAQLLTIIPIPKKKISLLAKGRSKGKIHLWPFCAHIIKLLSNNNINNRDKKYWKGLYIFWRLNFVAKEEGE